jgi:hypothetical protein
MTLHKYWSGQYISLGMGGRELNEPFSINVVPVRVSIRRGDGS